MGGVASAWLGFAHELAEMDGKSFSLAPEGGDGQGHVRSRPGQACLQNAFFRPAFSRRLRGTGLGLSKNRHRQRRVQ